MGSWSRPALGLVSGGVGGKRVAGSRWSVLVSAILLAVWAVNPSLQTPNATSFMSYVGE